MNDLSPDPRVPEETEKAGIEEPRFTLRLTDYEVQLLRQMIALDIHDWKSGTMSTEPSDPGFAQRRVRDSEALLAKLNDLQE